MPIERRKPLTANGVATVNFGMVDNAHAAYALLPKLKAANLDLIFCDMLTYATSSTFGITSTYDGRFKFVIAEGESVRGPIPATGNTNTRGFFKPDAVTFIKRWIAEGPTHHFALGIGHHAETIKLIGECLGIESVIVR